MAKTEKQAGAGRRLGERAWPLSRALIFAGIVLCGFGLDMATKFGVFHWLGTPRLGADNTWWLIEGWVGIQTAVNQGAVFGMGQGFGLGFAVLSVIAAVGIVYWLFFRGRARDLLLTVALGGVMAGIFGNLFDRLGLWHANPVYDALGWSILPDVDKAFQGGVRDWILFAYGGFELPVLGGSWPNFNIADSLLVCGAILLMTHAFFRREPKQEEASETSSKRKKVKAAA